MALGPMMLSETSKRSNFFASVDRHGPSTLVVCNLAVVWLSPNVRLLERDGGIARKSRRGAPKRVRVLSRREPLDNPLLVKRLRQLMDERDLIGSKLAAKAGL